MAARRLFDMVDNNERGVGIIAQPDQSLAKSRHGARVVFILIVSGVKRIDDDDVGLNGTGGLKEVIQAGRGTEHVTGGTRIDEEIGVGAIADGCAHGGQTQSKLRRGQFELTDQDAFLGWDMKARVLATGRQGQSEIGDKE
jgi:hypothetical protein